MILTLGITGVLLSSGIRKEGTGRTQDEILSLARIISMMPEAEISHKVLSLAGTSRARITLIDRSGTVIADSEANPKNMENHLNRVEIQQAMIKGEGAAIHFSRTLGVDMLYVALPLRDGSEIKGYLRLARPLLAIDAVIKKLVESIYYTIFIIIVLSLLIAFIFSWRLMSPIRKIADSTRRVRRGEIPGTLLMNSRDEIGQLAQDINYMVMELQEKIRLAKEGEGKLEAAFAGMTEGVIILDREDRIETVNRGINAILCNRYGPILNKTPLEAFRNVALHDALKRFKKERVPVLQEIIMEGTSPLILDVNISTVTDMTGGKDKTIMVFHDVTRLKRLETIRTDFVANVTHEIRTPLTAIIGFAETLQQGAFENPETARKFLRTIRENAERLNRLVDDLLTLSGLELGEEKLHLEGVRIEDALDQVLAVVEARAAEKVLTIRKEFAGELPLIRADRDRLAQILINILDNAIKFTPVGGTIAITASPGEEECLTVRIADTGVGIPKGEIPRLGERFYRADKTRSREPGGTGLGLSIVKHLMTAHGGRVIIDSTLGHGTTVSLYFPVFRKSN
jgi:two-component system phosphate regulon sensor histidine kinase PhoR